jgi:pimeloyl-ACP methyl ester carboxylesterase
MSETTLAARLSRSPNTAARTAPPLGRLYEVEGRRLVLHRAGEGGLTVVYLPGAGLTGHDFLNIHNAVAEFGASVIYDRGGTGWSDDITLPRSAADAAGELRALLRAAEVPGPYVLVGHSLGGAYARRFAQLCPDEVAGLVFLDPAHEGYQSMPRQTLLEQLKMAFAAAPKLLNMQKFYRPMFERMLAAWPDALRGTLVDYHVRNWRKTLAEAKNLQTEVLDEIRLGGPLPDAPLIVLTAMGIDPFMAPYMPEPYLRLLNQRKRDMYDAFARSVPRGENRLVPNAGHSTLHTDRPDAVVQAIRDVVERARG